MSYLVSVDHNGMAEHLSGCNLKRFKKCCLSSAVVVTGVDDMLWNDNG